MTSLNLTSFHVSGSPAVSRRPVAFRPPPYGRFGFIRILLCSPSSHADSGVQFFRAGIISLSHHDMRVRSETAGTTGQTFITFFLVPKPKFRNGNFFGLNRGSHNILLLTFALLRIFLILRQGCSFLFFLFQIIFKRIPNFIKQGNP